MSVYTEISVYQNGEADRMQLGYLLLSALAEAIGESTTRATLERRCAEVFREFGLSFSLQPTEAELRRWADSLDAKGLLLLPLRGFGVAGLFSARGDSPLPLRDLEKALSSLLWVGLEGLRRLEKVAALSRQANQERQRLLQDASLPAPIAKSQAMQEVLAEARRVALHDTTVLLRGESGTGKEVLARYLHQHSRRAHKPFIKVNCGALPASLLESALFGHERGAFTGATTLHKGLFERADKGTILLDEIAELPLSAQVKLLRVLQEGEVERVGAEQTTRVNVRVIAATHRNLDEMVARGEFRADLYFRLSTFPISLPPLRERPEDILPLAEALLSRIQERLVKPLSLSKEASQELLSYFWPGNVRELENVLERAAILSVDGVLRLPSLTSTPAQPPKKTLETWEGATRRLLQETLSACGGKIYGKDGAAARLKMKPSTLQSKLKKLGLRYQK